MIPSIILFLSVGCLETERQIASLITCDASYPYFTRIVTSVNVNATTPDVMSQISAISTGKLSANGRASHKAQTIFEMLKKNYQNYKRFALLKGDNFAAFTHMDAQAAADPSKNAVVQELAADVQLHFLLADFSGFSDTQMKMLSGAYSFVDEIGSKSFPALKNRHFAPFTESGAFEFSEEVLNALDYLHKTQDPFLLLVQMNDYPSQTAEDAVGECVEAFQLEKRLLQSLHHSDVLISVGLNGPAFYSLDTDPPTVSCDESLVERTRYFSTNTRYYPFRTQRNSLIAAYGFQLNNMNLMKNISHIKDVRHLCDGILALMGTETEILTTTRINYSAFGGLLVLIVLLCYFAFQFNYYSYYYKRRNA